MVDGSYLQQIIANLCKYRSSNFCLFIPFKISPLRRGVSNLLFVQSFCLHPSPLSDQLSRRKDAQLDIIIPTSQPRLSYFKILQDIVRYYKIL